MLNSLAVWVHNLDPMIFELWNGFGPRWYGLAYIIGLVAGWYIVKRWAEQERVPIQPIAVQDLAVYFGVGMIAGGRIGYCLFYDTSLLGFTSDFPFWRVLAVWEGGMASHGGIVGMFLGVLMYCKRNSINFLVIADASAVVTPIGICAGRLANFINGELWGRPTDVAWGIKFPESTSTDHSILREQYILEQWNKKIDTINSTNFIEQLNIVYLEYNKLYNDYNFDYKDAMERFHKLPAGSEEWIQIANQYVLTRHPSQLYAAFMEGIVVITVGMLIHRLHRRPGISMGVIFSVYAVMRFVNEFWRNPDPGYALYLGWMSKGQLLSLPLLAIGIFFIVWAYRRGPKPDIYSLPNETSKS